MNKDNQVQMAKPCQSSPNWHLVKDCQASLGVLDFNWFTRHYSFCSKISENSRPKMHLLILHSLDLVDGASRYLWLLALRLRYLSLLLNRHLLRNLVTFALLTVELVRFVVLLGFSGQLIQLLLASLSHSLYFKLMMIDASFAKRLRRDHCRELWPQNV